MSWMTPVSVLARGDAAFPGTVPPRGTPPDPHGPGPGGPLTPRSTDMEGLRFGVLGLVVPEQFLDAAAPLLQTVERQAEIGDRVPDRVVRGVALEPDQHRPLVRPGVE